MKVLQIDINGIENITNEILEIVIQNDILTVTYKNGNKYIWRLIQ